MTLLHRSAVLLMMAIAGCRETSPPPFDDDHIQLPPGFRIEAFAEVPGARTIVVAEEGAVIYVGTRDDQIYALLDPGLDREVDEVTVLADELEVPNGLALTDDGDLIVAERHQIQRLSKDGKREVLLPPGALPIDKFHGWRYAALGPDGWLYVAVGAPCNICTVEGLAGTIIRMKLDDPLPEIYASGVRNSVGFDWHPATDEMFFTDNGADDMGDLIPPDELNRAETAGLHFGFPYRYAEGESYGDVDETAMPDDIQHPAQNFEAHAAALGIHFYEGGMFPEDIRHDAFVAQHGSWNRTDPIGYRIMRVRFDDSGMPVAKEVFIDGWLGDDGEVRGRPVDLAELPDGSLLISDDYAGMLYRVTYDGD